MKNLFRKHQTKINILFTLVITVLVFYSGNIGQRISEIYTEFIIDGSSINTSVAFLSISASLRNNELIQKTLTQLNEVKLKYDEKWDNAEKELKVKKILQLWINIFIYLFIALQIIFNILIPPIPPDSKGSLE